MRSRGSGVGVLATALLLGLLSQGCAFFYDPPEVRVVGLRVASLGFTAGTAELDLDVHNRNSRDIEVRGLRYRLDVRRPEDDEEGGEDAADAWTVLAEGFHAEPTTLTGEERTRVTIEIPFDYEALGTAVRSFLREGRVRYRLEGALGIDGPLGEYEVPLRTTGALRP